MLYSILFEWWGRVYLFRFGGVYRLFGYSLWSIRWVGLYLGKVIYVCMHVYVLVNYVIMLYPCIFFE